jgi:hypothetical protein
MKQSILSTALFLLIVVIERVVRLASAVLLKAS